jgi:TonB family protein
MNLRPFFAGALCVVATVAAQAADSKLTNLSVRSAAGTGTSTLIVGFSIGGSGAKSVLIRGIGPTLSAFGVGGVVTDPQLQLYSGSGALIDQNDDWGGSATLASAFASVGAFVLPDTSRDAALFESLQPGSYSAQLIAASGPGLALVECYDPQAGLGSSYFSNVSARSTAGTGANVLTVGFAITGADPKPVLIRGIGPTLKNFGVSDALSAAKLRLFTSTGTEIGNNSGWGSSVTPASLFSGVGAFTLPIASADGVLFLALPSGTYTAQLSGTTSLSSGTALIELYEVNNSPVTYVTLQPVTNTALGAPADPGIGTPTIGSDAPASAVSQASPVYPFELRAASITGEVLVDFWVKTDGTVGNAVALRGTDVRLATSAVTAVQAWRFNPGRHSGQLVQTHFQVPIVFSLN